MYYNWNLFFIRNKTKTHGDIYFLYRCLLPPPTFVDFWPIRQLWYFMVELRKLFPNIKGHRFKVSKCILYYLKSCFICNLWSLRWSASCCCGVSLDGAVVPGNLVFGADWVRASLTINYIFIIFDFHYLSPLSPLSILHILFISLILIIFI